MCSSIEPPTSPAFVTRELNRDDDDQPLRDPDHNRNRRTSDPNYMQPGGFDAVVADTIPASALRISSLNDMNMRHRFVVQAIDPVTHCVTADVDFEVESPSELCEILVLEPCDFDPRCEYALDGETFSRVKDRFAPGFEVGDCYVTLRPWVRVDGLPYKVHTNRELAMMLAGEKPLAAFVAEDPANPAEDSMPESIFEPHVVSGRFIKREQICAIGAEVPPKRYVRRFLYALPGEQWRIDAYLLLHQTAIKSGWSEGFERLEGSLLGYQDWQNDAFIELMYRKAKRGS